MADRAARRVSFGRVAVEYERARPEYPLEAVRWLVGEAPLRVLDLGAGTGKLTRALLELGHDVVAVEPLPEMRAAFAAVLPGVPIVPGSAEAIPLPDAAVDAIAVGQAFHWFDPERAWPELARVLRPGGTLALIWNFRDARDAWVSALEEVVCGEGLGHDTTIGADDAGFGPVERREFAWSLRLDRDRLFDLVRSRSRHATLPDPEARAVLGRVGELVDRHPRLRADGSFDMPYRTEAYRIPRV